VAGSCEHGDEPAGSAATELVLVSLLVITLFYWTPYYLKNVFQLYSVIIIIHHPNDGGSMHLQNVGILQRD
jgi:hypothetical protein